jgi:hypothetical protein
MWYCWKKDKIKKEFAELHGYQVCYIWEDEIKHNKLNLLEFVEKRLDEAQYPVKAYRTLIAILSLAKLYGKIELNLALAYALKIDAKSVKSIESILSKKLYLVAANNVVKSNVFNNHENIRGSDYYK